MEIENLGNIVTSLVSGTVMGILIGYAVKKLLKIVLVILGIFFAAISYLQFQGMLSINWDKIEVVSKDTVATIIDSEVSENAVNSIMTSVGLPLSGGMAMGFAVGFMKG